MTTEKRLAEIEKRLDRLERLVFVGFQEVRDVAEYAYENAMSPEEVKRPSWRRPGLTPLSDQEAIAIGGLAVHELASLKMTMRHLRKQTRRDALGIVRDLMRRSRKQAMKDDEEQEPGFFALVRKGAKDKNELYRAFPLTLPAPARSWRRRIQRRPATG